MKQRIIKIGNSKGLRLSKSILERYNIKDEIELIFEEERIILRPVDTPRKNWSAKFIEMHLNDDDSLLVDDVFRDDSFEEWQ
jgi:antitoxin MazE